MWTMAAKDQYSPLIEKQHIHTHARRVLAKVASLVPLKEALGLDGRGLATGQLLVEGDDAIHAGGISGRANAL